MGISQMAGPTVKSMRENTGENEKLLDDLDHIRNKSAKIRVGKTI